MVSSSFKMSLRIENWTDFCLWFPMVWDFMLCAWVAFFSFQFAFGCHVKWQVFFASLLFSSCFCFPTFDRQQTRGIEYWIHKKKIKQKITKKQQIRIHVKYSLKAIENWATVHQQWKAMERNECQREREKEKIFNLSKLIMMSG